ncbi:MAG: hypothetical protein ABIS29_16985, partial [Vicinamibacterales bacterium]
MANTSAARFLFIAHALRGDGGFRPTIWAENGYSATGQQTYLIRYPRESNLKFARRNELAFYASPLAQACARFSGYLAMRSVQRDAQHDLYKAIIDDVDGRGNSADVFFSMFIQEAKARGSMLLLVDMPQTVGGNQGAQIAGRIAPFWTSIEPEAVTEYTLGDDGKFDLVEFSGNFTRDDGSRVPCLWRFDRASWTALNPQSKQQIASGTHPLGECPVIIFTEGGSFPHFGPFAAVADLSKRLFNLDSELDEILRAQTFSLLTMSVPDGSTDAQKLEAARVAGETIGTNNLMVHSGSTPAFIAPPDGPARIYIDRIEQMRAQINEIGLNVATVNQQESGIAMQMRFQSINAELSRFSARMEDFERRAWELCKRWLGMTQAPDIQWPRDFNLADIGQELKVLTDMQSTAMPVQVLVEQQKRIVAVQFGGL